MGFFSIYAADKGTKKHRDKNKDEMTLIYLSPSEILLPKSGNNSRKGFDKLKMSELVESVEQNGILSPICVGKTPDGYELIYGERRLRAAVTAKLSKIPCIIAKHSEQPKLISLIENLQREDLSFFEQADGIYSLIDEYKMTRHEVGQKLGLSDSAISNKLRLLRLTPSQRESIENMGLTERHARTLLRICDEQDRTRALREIIDRRMNVEEAEKYVDRLLMPKTAKNRNKLVVKDIRLFVNSINKAINIMKISGINAKSQREEDDDYIRYTVLIPKKANDIDNEAM